MREATQMNVWQPIRDISNTFENATPFLLKLDIKETSISHF